MLLGNYSKINANPGRNIGGITNPYDWMKTSNMMKFYYGNSSVQDVTERSSFNNGYLPPYSFVIAPKPGGIVISILGSSELSISMTPQFKAIVEFTGNGDLANTITVYGNLLSNLLGSSDWSASGTPYGHLIMSFEGHGDLIATSNGQINASVQLTGSSTMSADLYKLSLMICNMVGTGSLTPDAILLLYLLSELDGQGGLDISIRGVKRLACTLEGHGDFISNLEGLANILIQLIGDGSIDVDINSIADMSIDIVTTGTGLTTSNVGSAVWSALQSDINILGSAGAALLAAGSAGDPWSTNLPGAYDNTQAGNILSQIRTLIDELHKIEGLDIASPMTVTSNSRSAGDINLIISGDGETYTKVERDD